MERSLFEIDHGCLRRYRGNERCVTVPDGVRQIDMYAFYGCDKVEEVTLPKEATEFTHASLGTMPQLKTVRFLTKDVLHIRTSLFYESSSPLTIIYEGTSDTFLQSVAPYGTHVREYDNGHGGGAPGFYSEDREYFPLGHRLDDEVIYRVTCLEDGKSFTLKGKSGKPDFSENEAPAR